jgi:hypothetical protein
MHAFEYLEIWSRSDWLVPLRLFYAGGGKRGLFGGKAGASMPHGTALAKRPLAWRQHGASILIILQPCSSAFENLAFLPVERRQNAGCGELRFLTADKHR